MQLFDAPFFFCFSEFSDIFVFKIQCMLVNVHVLHFSDTHFMTTRSSICTSDTILYPEIGKVPLKRQ